MHMWQIYFVFYFLSILISVAFLTLFERKILSVMHQRLGPTKNLFLGVIQPITDALKLFSKTTISLSKSSKILYLIAPTYFILLSLLFFFFFPLKTGLMFSINLLILVFLFSMGVYSPLITGWTSNSKYSLIGSMRSIMQSISYEILLSLIFLTLAIIFSTFSIYKILKFKFYNLFFSFFILILLFLTLVIESNRPPFDLSESESELVSGFNVEYGGLEFSLIFLGENLMIIFNACLISVTLLLTNFQFVNLYFMWLVVSLRASYPRYRFDLLVSLCWLTLIPMSLMYMIVVWIMF